MGVGGDRDLKEMELGKYAIDLIPVKSCKKSFVFLMTLTLTIP